MYMRRLPLLSQALAMSAFCGICKKGGSYPSKVIYRETAMKQYIYQRRWLRKTVGILLIAFGLFAFIMPLVPGAILAVVGLELMGVRLAFFDRLFPNRVPREVEPAEVLLPVEG